MAAINVDKMPLKDLIELNQRVQKAIVSAKDRERTELKQKIALMAESSGFSVGELFGTRAASGRGKGGAIGVAKYRNPDNPSETWTGRGRKPNWLVGRLAKGAKLDDFEI